MPRSLSRALLVPLVALATLATAGCETLLFRFANRGLEAPDATVAFAPDRGLSLDVYRPPADAGASVPVVVFFYGGAWRRGERWQYRFVGQRLAAQGVVAIVPDYRTHPDATFPGFMDDAARAVAWARRHAARHGGDPGRVFLAGHSAGAHIAALLATDPRHLAAHGEDATALAGVVGLAGPTTSTWGPDSRTCSARRPTGHAHGR